MKKRRNTAPGFKALDPEFVLFMKGNKKRKIIKFQVGKYFLHIPISYAIKGLFISRLNNLVNLKKLNFTSDIKPYRQTKLDDRN